MKKTLTFLIVLTTIFSCSEKSSNTKPINEQWNKEKREQHLSNRGDSATWDLEMLQNDHQFIGIGDLGPFEIGVFPVPNYDIIGQGSFKGLGNIGDELPFGDKNIIMNSFFIGENELNKNRLNGLKSDVFFQILVLTDTIDNENYNLNKSIAISRNHPDYLGQGFIQTKNNRIDYMAFQTAENESFAVINARIFDLNFGKTILIAPQKDRSLRSMQIKSLEITSDSIMAYTNELIKEKKIIEFFENKENL